MKCQIRTKMVLAICLPLAAVYLLLLVIEYRRGKQEALEQMKVYLTELAAHEASDLDERLTGVAQVARSTADFLDTFPPQEEEAIYRLAEWYELPELAELGREMIAGKRGVRRIPDFETGQPKWAVVAPVSSTGWSLAAMIPEEHVLAPVYDRVTGIRSRDEIREFADTFNQMFGEEGLKRLVGQLHDVPVESLCQQVLDRVNDHRRGEAQDDVTLLALKRGG